MDVPIPNNQKEDGPSPKGQGELLCSCENWVYATLRIYKVETVKDSFVGVSGAPEKVKNHAEKIMDMAMDMRDCVSFVKGEKKIKRIYSMRYWYLIG